MDRERLVIRYIVKQRQRGRERHRKTDTERKETERDSDRMRQRERDFYYVRNVVRIFFFFGGGGGGKKTHGNVAHNDHQVPVRPTLAVVGRNS